MAVIVNKEDDKNVELSRRISADLREKMEESSKIGDADPDFAEGSEYVKDFSKTGKFAWIWLVALVVAVIIIVAISLNK